MANRPFLMAHKSATPLTASGANQTILAAASNQIPLLWLSLFSESDLRTVEIPLEDAAGNESTGGVPTLHAPTEAVRARYQMRRTTLRAKIPADLHSHIDEWEALLASVNQPYIQIDLAEIWMMFMPDEFNQRIRRDLRAFEQGGDLWRDVCAQAGVEMNLRSGETSFDPDVARYGLRGYQWDVPVPWKD